MDALLQDFRYAWRGLLKTPGFTAIALLTLTVGIGANTAMFTLVDQVLLRLLPIRNPQELVLITTRGQYYGNTWGDGSALSYPAYADLRDHNQVFAGMLGRFNAQMYVRLDGSAERVSAELVSGSYFPVLGVGAAQGRAIVPTDDRVDGDPSVVVLSHRYWLGRFGGDPRTIGKTMTANNHVLTIIGVAEEGFDGTNVGSATQIFVPVKMTTVLTDLRNGLGNRPVLEDSRTRWLNVFGRLRPGTTIEAARTSLRPFYASRLALEVQEDGFGRASAADKARYLNSTIDVLPAGQGKSALRDKALRPLSILMAIAAIVLLIACANLAGLLLVRATARHREFAVRLAMGATRWRLSQQLLVESTLLAVAGSMGGLIVATWGSGVVLRFVSDPENPLTVSVSPDGRILAFNLVVAVLTGIGFGLAPALQSTRPELAPTLKNESGTVAGGGYGRVRRSFVISQVALSVLLLVGAGLFVRSLHNLMNADLGLDTTRVVSFRVDPDANGYGAAQGKAFAKALRERIQTTPGVAAAAFATQQLLTGSAWSNFITIEGRAYDPEQRVVSLNNGVSPGYFTTMGIPLIAGRDFDSRDERMPPASSPLSGVRVAIANEAFGRKYLNGTPAVGRRIGFGRDPGTPTPIEIIGVVGDAKYTSVRDDIQPQLYFPFLEGPRVGLLTMYIRTRDNPVVMARALVGVANQLDPTLPVSDVRTLAQQVDRSITSDRLIANLSAVFGVLATFLAMIGLYGVMAYSVTRRTREIGVRIALGAASHNISWLVMREVAVLVLMGSAMALPAVWGLSRFVESQLYGIAPTDPATVGFAIGSLAVVAAVAAFVPARRAVRVDPLVALRYE